MWIKYRTKYRQEENYRTNIDHVSHAAGAPMIYCGEGRAGDLLHPGGKYTSSVHLWVYSIQYTIQVCVCGGECMLHPVRGLLLGAGRFYKAVYPPLRTVYTPPPPERKEIQPE